MEGIFSYVDMDENEELDACEARFSGVCGASFDGLGAQMTFFLRTFLTVETWAFLPDLSSSADIRWPQA